MRMNAQIIVQYDGHHKRSKHKEKQSNQLLWGFIATQIHNWLQDTVELKWLEQLWGDRNWF